MAQFTIYGCATWVCVTWNLCIVNLTSIFLILRAKDRLCSASLDLVAATNFAVTNLSVRIIPRPAWMHKIGGSGGITSDVST